MSAVQSLKDAISSGRAVILVGAGGSVFSTRNAPTASWAGLIRSGIQFVVDHEEADTGRWKGIIESQLSYALEEGDEDQILQAASGVAARVHRMGDQAFANWMQQAFSGLSVTDDRLIKAIADLRAPIFTTNYDHLLEVGTGLPGLDWTNPRGFQSILTAGGAIGHLHGMYNNPQSVVLSAVDYERQAQAEPVQALQKAISAIKSIVYVGCGGTLDDPNFSSLLDWHRSVFPDSAITHYRLCINAELTALRARHRDDNITPVGFGESYEDLPQFVQSLAPAVGESVAVVRDVVQESREYLLEQLRSESIVGEGLDDLEDRTLHGLTIPPVLLPVPHGEFLRAKNDAEAKVERHDAGEVSCRSGVVVVIGEENSGMSTTLRWLVHEASVARTTVPAQFIDFRSVGAGRGPLERLLRREALYRGLIHDKKAPLPDSILGIDNFAPGERGSRVADEIAARSELTVIGCRSANESAVIDTLRKAGCRPDVVYLGKLEFRDIKAMAGLVSSRVDSVAAAILTTLQSEHLPRTPFTIGLLIAIMLRGEKLVANASPTTILEQYVGILLGRDDPDQDSTRGLTQNSRESILSDLAVLFLEHDKGSVLQSDVTVRMEGFFSRYAWPESPSEVLADLVQRRILVYEESSVRFAQSSFLHLFVAKAAARDLNVRSTLLSRPIYYATVLRAHAALVRNDAGLLRDLVPLVENLWATEDSRSPFARRDEIDAPVDLLERLASTALPAAPTDSANEGAHEAHPFDHTEDLDVLPFPLNSDEDLPRLAKYAQALELVSYVLRDSEEVDDLALKRSALASILRGWGHLIEALAEDEAFAEATRAIQGKLEELDDGALFSERSIELFVSILPMIIAFTGLEVALASRTLVLIANQHVGEDEEAMSEPRSAIPAAMLLYTLKDPGWEDQVVSIVARHARTGAVQDFFYVLLLLAYGSAAPSSRAETKLRDTVADIWVSGFKYQGREHRAQVRSAYIQHISQLKSRGELTSGGNHFDN